MKKRNLSLALFLVGIGLTSVQAQQAILPAGGNAFGLGGTVSYSIGQIDYTSHADAEGSVAQGVQQAIEISIVSGLDEEGISLNVQAYPNPTADYLTLDLGEFYLSNLNYQLFDLSGRLITDKEIINSTETILMERLASGIYFLKVLSQNDVLKTFKIIKN